MREWPGIARSGPKNQGTHGLATAIGASLPIDCMSPGFDSSVYSSNYISFSNCPFPNCLLLTYDAPTMAGPTICCNKKELTKSRLETL